jgi:hypothetical protein
VILLIISYLDTLNGFLYFLLDSTAESGEGIYTHVSASKQA